RDRRMARAGQVSRGGRARPQHRRADGAGRLMTLQVPGRRELPTVEDTRALGEELAGLLSAGDVVVLDGPLGAGKTALTGGIAAGLGVRGRVTSPTFVIARRHAPATPGGPGLVHVDAYRLLGQDPDGDQPSRRD